MKRTIYITLGIVLIIVLVAYLRYSSNRYIAVSGFTQGTTYMVKVVNKFDLKDMLQDETPDVLELIENTLTRFDSSLNAYVPYSIISQINKNQLDVELSSYFTECFNRAYDINEETDGAFDITGGPLFNAWGFGPGKKKEVTDELLDSLLEFVGMDKISIVDNRIVKDHPGIKINVNAIAQGYSVDVVAEELEKAGYSDYIVEIGGELKAKGNKIKSKKWIVGIDKPIDNNNQPGANLQLTMPLEDKALATSGNYRKFFIEDGVKYAHSINPKTGKPVKHTLLSATVLADDCMTADAYATSFMVKGLEWSKIFAAKHPEIDVYFIYSDSLGNYQEYYSEGFEQIVKK